MNDDDPDFGTKRAVSAVEAVELLVPAIRAAIEDMRAKHGPLTRDSMRAYAIMQKEMGEVAEAILDLTRLVNAHEGVAELPPDVVELGDRMINHLGLEITQVVAIGIYMLINLFGDQIEVGEMPTLVPGSDKVM